VHGHFHVRHFHVSHWLLWWFSVGLILAAIAAVNILEHQLQRSQDLFLLLFFAMFWLLSGMVCYGLDEAQWRRRRR
jgi:hypothetical protein